MPRVNSLKDTAQFLAIWRFKCQSNLYHPNISVAICKELGTMPIAGIAQNQIVTN